MIFHGYVSLPEVSKKRKLFFVHVWVGMQNYYLQTNENSSEIRQKKYFQVGISLKTLLS